MAVFTFQNTLDTIMQESKATFTGKQRGMEEIFQHVKTWLVGLINQSTADMAWTLEETELMAAYWDNTLQGWMEKFQAIHEKNLTTMGRVREGTDQLRGLRKADVLKQGAEEASITKMNAELHQYSVDLPIVKRRCEETHSHRKAITEETKELKKQNKRWVLMGWLSYCVGECLIDWLAVCSIFDWHTSWLIDWLINVGLRCFCLAYLNIDLFWKRFSSILFLHPSECNE